MSRRHKSRGDPRSRTGLQCGQAIVREGAQRPGIEVHIYAYIYGVCKIERQNSMKTEKIYRGELDNDHALRFSLRLPEPRITSVVGQAHPKKIIAIRPHEITHHSMTHCTTQQAEQQQQLHLVE